MRVNPDFELKGSGMKMGGGPKQFGVDVEQMPALLDRIGAAGLAFEGFHLFAGSQNLRAESICEAQRKSYDLALRLAADAPAPVRFLNLGGGFGIPYFPGEQPLDLAPIADNLAALVARVRTDLPDASLVIELGRYLVGEAGVYVTRIVDRKVSRGQVFLVTDGGLNHHLSASGNFGQVVRKNYPVAIGNRMNADAREAASVVGPLCTPLDLLADRMELPVAQRGRPRRRLPVGRLRREREPAGLPRTRRLPRSAGLKAAAGRAGVPGRLPGALVAALAAAAGAALASRHPLSAPAASLGFALWCVAAARWRGLWLCLVPAALPLASLAPWTGWLAFDESDLLVLGAIAGGHARQAWDARHGRPRRRRRLRMRMPVPGRRASTRRCSPRWPCSPPSPSRAAWPMPAAGASTCSRTTTGRSTPGGSPSRCRTRCCSRRWPGGCSARRRPRRRAGSPPACSAGWRWCRWPCCGSAPRIRGCTTGATPTARRRCSGRCTSAARPSTPSWC